MKLEEWLLRLDILGYKMSMIIFIPKYEGEEKMSKWEDTRREDIRIIYGISREYFERKLQSIDIKMEKCTQPNKLKQLRQQKMVTDRRLRQVNILSNMRW